MKIGTMSLTILSCSILISSSLSANERIDKAVDVVSKLCLSGTEWGIEADANGNISIKDFRPKGKGSITLNVRNAVGATAFQENLRIIADKDIRECTQLHIGRIIDALLSTSQPAESTELIDYKSVDDAKYLGVVPTKVSVTDFVEGTEGPYYRIHIKEPTELKVKASNNSHNLYITVLTKSEKVIRNIILGDGKTSKPLFLVKGDFYFKVALYSDSTATPFTLDIVARK